MFDRVKTQIWAVLLPLLVAAYPVIYLYGQNADSLTPLSLRMPLSAALLTAAAAYAFFLLLLRRPLAASLASGVFVVFYHLYGHLYRWLVKLDLVPIEHYLLLAVILYLVGYAAYFLGRLRPAALQAPHKILLIVAAALVAINVAITLPVEVKNAAAAAAEERSAASIIPVASHPGEERTYPDIYYIVFDEYAGFNTIREYWQDDYVDEFEEYLVEKGFYVADQSRSDTLSTAIEMASRLDLWPYPADTDDRTALRAVRQNRVMQILKAHGYTTVALSMAFQSVEADISVQYDVSLIGGLAVDEFRQKFIDDTMLLLFRRHFLDNDPSGPKHRDTILETLENTASLPGVESPKFVFTHILLPHMPFIFDEDGSLLDPAYKDDWSAYLGQHKYSTVLARQLIDRLLSEADPNNPPVIIFQSDHGARNINRWTRGDEPLILTGYLENYSLDNAHDIVNALYLPGFDQRQLNKAMAPIDTFIIVLNHYLDADIKVEDPANR